MKVAFLLLLAAGLIGCRSNRPSTGPHVTIGGRTWRVELASTDSQRQRGLAGRSELPADAGMLFVFDQPQILHFYMRGCLISLDIAFIGPDHRVMAIHTMAAEPDRAGRAIYNSPGPAQFALEVAGGQLAAGGVKVGDLVTFSSDIPLPAKGATNPGR